MIKLNFCNYLATASTLLATVVVVACVAVAGGSLAAAQTPMSAATSATPAPTPVHLPQPTAAPTAHPHAAAQAQAHPTAATAATVPQVPTAPTVDASELDTLRITNALQDFQLNQATIKDAQGQVESMRQTLIHSIASAAADLHLTPDYQWDFQQKKFIKQQSTAPTAPVTGQAVKK